MVSHVYNSMTIFSLLDLMTLLSGSGTSKLVNVYEYSAVTLPVYAHYNSMIRN
jgi:hypothetical protein